MNSIPSDVPVPGGAFQASSPNPSDGDAVKLGSTRPRIAAAPSRLSPAPKKALPFYQSAEWRELRERRRLDADYREALRRAKVDGSKRVILDHVVEIRDGGAPLDPANTEWLTFAEHQRKTERAKRARVGRG